MDRETLHLFLPDGRFSFGYSLELDAGGTDSNDAHSLAAPMPGKVIALMVQAGTRVRKGQALLVMEAMKMEHTITAPADGLVEKLPFNVGDLVGEGAALVGFAAD
jgi:3-methylcrotonyl-CoA carboxylase alpha subunit